MKTFILALGFDFGKIVCEMTEKRRFWNPVSLEHPLLVEKNNDLTTVLPAERG